MLKELQQFFAVDNKLHNVEVNKSVKTFSMTVETVRCAVKVNSTAAQQPCIIKINIADQVNINIVL